MFLEENNFIGKISYVTPLINIQFFLFAVIFGVYANESGTHIIRSEMLRQLQATERGYTPEILHKCFGQVRNIPPFLVVFVFC